MELVETTTKLKCYHCGEECENEHIRIDDKFFCCEGCKLVYQLLAENNLCDYYSLNEQPGKTQSKNLFKKKYEFLDDDDLKKQLLEFTNDKISTITFFIPDMHCSSCIWLLENLYKINSGILNSKVNFLEKRISVTFNHYEISLRQLVELLASIGYEPQINLSETTEKIRQSRTNYNKKLYYKLGIAGFAFGNIMLLSFPEYLSIDASSELLKRVFSGFIILLSIPVFFYCAIDYFISAFKGLRKKIINIDFPLSLGIIVLYLRSLYEIIFQSGAGYMDSFAGLIFFLLLGKLFQNKTYETLNFERDYKSFFPISVTIKKDGEEKSIPLSKLKVKDKIIVRNNELIPADSYLLKGNANIDYSFITGEAEPIQKSVGELIYAGGKQAGGIIELETAKEVSQSYLTKLWNQSETGNYKYLKNDEHNLTSWSNFISKYFTFVVLLIAFVSAFYWIKNDITLAVTVFTSVLIVACPCALALSTPFALGNSLRIFGRNNFYLKNINVIEELSKATSVVFDKTGTITSIGNHQINFIGDELSNEEKIIIKSLVKNSTHPLSKKIFSYLNATDEKRILPVQNFEEKIGKGMIGLINNKVVKAGSKKFIFEKTNQELQGNDYKFSEVHISIDDKYKGTYQIKNSYRENIGRVIKNLIKKYEVYLLSGDNDSEKEKLQNIFEDERKIYFHQSPFDKLNFIKKLREKNKVIMIGDGLNDSAALLNSDVGISVTEDITTFTPASDGILHADSLKLLDIFLKFSKDSVNVIKVSFIISLLYNLIGLSVAVSGNLSPLFAAILMPLSSISVVIFTTLMTNILGRKRGLYLNHREHN
ncbi:MAG: heavy metal translocating P-type ATPase metal-binding domain-containing protein [Ignavibacterium sp.]